MSSNQIQQSLDIHSLMIMDEYYRDLPKFEKIKDLVIEIISNILQKNNILVTALEARVKTESSLMGKLILKGSKYKSLSDLTDIVGARVITFYSDEVDKIAALAERTFEIDWDNSVDKRKMHELNSFGYMSLHYICRIPKSVYFNPEYPEINEYRFELQMRTALQHVWANMYHDTGYKSGVEVPKEHLRNLTRLAGMLELADEEFSRIRIEINDYRRKVQDLVKEGNFDAVALNGDTFMSYMNIDPFGPLLHKMAAINQAEIVSVSPMPFVDIFLSFGFKTLGDIERLKNKYSDDAYQLTLYQIGDSDLDIMSSTLVLQNLIIVYLLRTGGGMKDLRYFFGKLNGVSDYNEQHAQLIIDQARKINLIKD